ncbi:unnamed protein product [Orchesella dallaii]|uniref:RNase III domain-containing protein n=1 Tax=Orchesella dallaii TaxID=48710 RepID=A0ABP1RM79_9HEXA
MSNLRQLESKIGYSFTNQALLKEAVTHGSSRNTNANRNLPHHERLEYLGDAILYTVISEYLFKHDPDADPGTLSTLRQELISDRKQNIIAEQLQIYDHVNMNASLSRYQFRRYGEFVEAIIGAVYIDAGGGDMNGLRKAKDVIFRLWGLEDPPSAFCVIA